MFNVVFIWKNIRRVWETVKGGPTVLIAPAAVIQGPMPVAASTSPSPLVTLTMIETPLGPMAAAAIDAGICLLEYTDPQRLETQMEGLRRRMGPEILDG